MHKQLLTTAFAAFLALAFVFGVIKPTAQSNARDQVTDIPAQESTAAPPESESGEEIESETVPETEKNEPPETEGDEKGEELVFPDVPQGARVLSLYINGRAAPRGICFEEDGQIWLGIDAFGELIGTELFSARAGDPYITSGDRVIPCSANDIEVKVRDHGALCAPIAPLLSAAGLRATEIVGGEICIWGVPTFPRAEDIYSAEDLYWLSRIISAEARGEPFLGQLAVGTVVINRTNSDYYPDTIYGVIFDRNGGVQFTPASTGSVHRDPTASSILAAKLCLEGFSLNEGILFFFNSKLALGSWITSNRTYTMTVGQHDFYS